MNIAYAAPGYAEAIVLKMKYVIIYPLVTLLLAVAMLVFLWGVFQYVMNGADESARAEGKRHIFFGIIGFVIMLSAVAIFNIALGTVGLGGVRSF